MATNSDVTKVHKSLMQNTAKGTTAATKKKGTATTAAKKTTGSAAAKTSTQKKNQRSYTRNGTAASLIGSGMAAFGGAAVITGVDLLVNQYAPNLSTGIRTGVKIVGGVAFKMWGKKIPVVGAYSDTIGNALLLAGALDVLGNTVVPYVVNWLAPAPAPVQIKDPATGQLGMQYQMPNGEVMQVFNDSQNSAYGNNYASDGAYQQANYWRQ